MVQVPLGNLSQLPGYSEEQVGITLGKFKDDFEEVGQSPFGKYNDQIKNIKLP